MILFLILMSIFFFNLSIRYKLSGKRLEEMIVVILGWTFEILAILACIAKVFNLVLI